MKKIRLQVESLNVVSFATESAGAPPRGTVLGQETGSADSCIPAGCWPMTGPEPFSCGTCHVVCQRPTDLCVTKPVDECMVLTAEITCLETCAEYCTA